MTLKENESEVSAADRLLDLREVARRLGVCVRTVRREMDRGKLGPAVRVGAAVRVFERDLADYLAKLKGASYVQR